MVEMRFSRIATFVALPLAVDVVADMCKGNNCLRAIKGIARRKNGTADCLFFFQVTATPSPRTSTTTVTVTASVRTFTFSANSTTSGTKNASTIGSLESHGERDAEYEPVFDTPGQIQPLEEPNLTSSRSTARSTSHSTSSPPKYATPCSSLVAYSSACSCIGISRATTTVPVSASTRTLTTTKIVANVTVFANHTTARGNNTVGHGWNASSSPTIWKSDSGATLGRTSQKPSAAAGSSQLLAISSTSSVVFVLDTTTLVTAITPARTNTSSSISESWASNGFTGRFTKPTTLPSNVSANTTANSKLDISTAASPFVQNDTTPRWQNTSTAALLFANSTRSMWLNTSFPTRGPNITTGRWLNTTSPTRTANITTGGWLNTAMMILPIPTNATSFRWLNSTMLPNATTARRLDTSSFIPTPTPTTDLACGETSNPFALQASQPGGMYDGWYVHVSGNGLLFTSARSSASSFSVEASGYLCAMGRLDRSDRPRIAAVGIRDPSSEVWLVESQTLEVLDEDYAVIKCTTDGSLSCVANATNPASYWLGCGLQLDLSTDGGGTIPVRKLNYTSLALSVISAAQ